MAKGSATSRRLCAWQDAISQHWERIHFGELRIEEDAGAYHFSVPVYLDDLDPDYIAVELYAAPPDETAGELHRMQRGDLLSGAVNSFTYTVSVPKTRAAGDYTPRIVPVFEGARVPIEARQILWYH